MGKHLSADCVTKIVQEMINFNGKIKWDDVLGIAEEVTGTRPKNYRTFYAHDDIVTAYNNNIDRDENDQGVQQGTRKKSLEVRKLEERIAKLKAEKQFLEAVNTQLYEKFLLWVDNASKKNLTEADLEGTGRLPLIDRQPTED